MEKHTRNDAGNRHHRTIPRERSSECCKTIEAGGCGKTFDLADIQEAAVVLHREDADGSGACVEGVDKAAVLADRGIEVCASGGIGANDRGSDWCEGAIVR